MGPGAEGFELGKDYGFLLDLRETGDYGGVAAVACPDARLAVEKAAGLIRALGRLCPDLGGGAGGRSADGDAP